MEIPGPKGPPAIVNLIVINALAHGLAQARKEGLITDEQFLRLYLSGMRREDSQRLLSLLE